MKEKRSFPGGCSLAILSIILGICLTLGTTMYQRQNDPVCRGNLSAGFPLPFLCDESGGSPISSWGRIDWWELFGMNLNVFLLDFLLYGALISIAWLVGVGLVRNEVSQNENFRRGILLCMGYMVAFLFAFISFQSGRLNFERPTATGTPTPTFFTPTSPGTLPPPEATPAT